MATRLHYQGQIFDLDPRWAHSWYETKIAQVYGDLASPEVTWMSQWFWLEQNRHRYAEFQFTAATQYVLEKTGPDIEGAITDPRVYN